MPLHVKYITAITRPPFERLNENSVRTAGRMAGSILGNMSIKKWTDASTNRCIQ